MMLVRKSTLIAAVVYGLLGSQPAHAQAPPSFAEPSTPVHTAPLPWWDDEVRQPLNAQAQPLGLDLDSTVCGVLMFSPLVRIAADAPVIRQTQIADAASRFDPRVFVDSKFTDTSDPVGNTLTTGGANRFIDQNAVSTAGLRKTFTTGGELEAAQRLGYEDNNSNFFIPKDQATSKITLIYTHPLLRGRGKCYNTSAIYIAELNTNVAASQMQRDLQEVLLDVHRAYWDLQLRRAALLQRMRLKQQAIDIQAELRARADFDVLRSQVVRADAAVATRDAAVIRFNTEIANAETRLRALINDPQLAAVPTELVPTMTPVREEFEPDLVEALTVALQSRPEIHAAFAEVRAAGVRADVSQSDLLPELNFLLGTYVYGLQGQSNMSQAWVDQFALGRPTYWTGLQFEYPLGNRAPRARRMQRLVELRQTTAKLQQTMIQVRAETETAVREVVTTYREMISKYHAMQADQAEIDYLTSRWRLLAGEEQLAGVMLNDLLSAQERLADAEFDFAAAEAAYNISLVKLNAVTGTLLQSEQVELIDTSVCGVPMIDVRSSPSVGNGQGFVPVAPQPRLDQEPPVQLPPVPMPPSVPQAPAVSTPLTVQRVVPTAPQPAAAQATLLPPRPQTEPPPPVVSPPVDDARGNPFSSRRPASQPRILPLPPVESPSGPELSAP